MSIDIRFSEGAECLYCHGHHGITASLVPMEPAASPAVLRWLCEVSHRLSASVNAQFAEHVFQRLSQHIRSRKDSDGA